MVMRLYATGIRGTEFAGFHDILHGGIQATMMDEIASWVVLVKLDTSGVTYPLEYPLQGACSYIQGRDFPARKAGGSAQEHRDH